MRKINFLWQLSAGLLIYFCCSCAIVKTPDGGPKDITPPKIIRENPENLKVNFDKKRIDIIFNEFIQVKDIKQNLMISPSLAEEPDIVVKNNKISIIFKENLKENTTYNLNFGNCISDLNEGNVINNYRYIFSTGNKIDSGRISGAVKDAFSQKYIAGVIMCLYEKKCDSCFFNKKPIYYSRSDSSGNFKIENIKNDTYRIFALLDENNNLRYDYGEKIGFVKDLVDVNGNESKVNFELFQERNSVPKLIDSKLYSDSRFKIIFNAPVKEVLVYQQSKEGVQRLKYKKNNSQDSLTVWSIQETTDTLYYRIKYCQTDTVLKGMIKKEENLKKDKKKKLIINGINDLYKSEKLNLIFSEPVIRIGKNEITIKKDTIKSEQPLKYSFTDSSMTVLTLDYEIIPGVNYTFIFPDSMFYGIYQTVNDSFIFSTSMKNENELGAITVQINIPGSADHAIAELISSNGDVIRNKIFKGNTRISFKNLIPDQYSIRVVLDENNDGKWNSGSLSEKKQPEKVYYLPEKLLLKSNWEITDIIFTIPEN